MGEPATALQHLQFLSGGVEHLDPQFSLSFETVGATIDQLQPAYCTAYGWCSNVFDTYWTGAGSGTYRLVLSYEGQHLQTTFKVG
jgi:hypothetical protein